jgi:DNA-directed RNA polymerase specialized sigma24 family protein
MAWSSTCTAAARSKRLPAKARQALLLCKLDGMSYRDIAAELQVSVSSVEKYIAAGLLACYQALHGQDA